jgi:hypothetical protein
LIFNGDSEPFTEDGERISPDSIYSEKASLFDLEDNGLFYQIDLPQVFISAIQRSPARLPRETTRPNAFRRWLSSSDFVTEEKKVVTYGLLFRYLLKKESTLAMGLYRQEEGENQVIRYTVVNPPSGLELRENDLVFVFSGERDLTGE